MNHVVVTGGAGFLGAHLCRMLVARGDQVTAIDNLSTGCASALADLHAYPRFTLRTADVTALGAFAELDSVTHVVHLAGAGGDPIRRAADTIRVASTGTLAALDLAAARGARIVVVSGHRSYDEPDGRAWSRTGTFGPTDHACIRQAAELITEAAARRYRGVNAGTARLFEVYGPGLRPSGGVGAMICAAALRDQTLYIAHDKARSFVYVTDAAAALVAMLDSDIAGPVDIGGPAITLAEFARIAIELAGSGWLEYPCGPRSMKAGGRGIASTSSCTAPPLPDYAASEDGSALASRPDLTRTHALLGWQPATGLHRGVHLTLDWMRTALSSR